MCTFQAQLLVECRSTGCRVSITVYGVRCIRELFHLFCQIRQVHDFTRRQFSGTNLEEYGTRCDIRIRNNHLCFCYFSHRLVFSLYQCILQFCILCTHDSQLILHSGQFDLRDQLRHRATETTGGETISQTNRSAQYAIISVITTYFTIKFIFSSHCAQFQVNIYRIRNTEFIDNTCIYRQSFAMRFGVIVSETGTYIRNNLINTMLIITSEKSIQIEHHVTVQVHIVKTLFIVTVFQLGTLHVVGTFIISKASSLQTAILQTQSQTGSKPFTDRDIQCRTDTLTKTSCTIIITKSSFSTAADREEPIAPKRIGDYLIFILYLDNFVFDYFSLLLRHSSRRQTGQSQ